MTWPEHPVIYELNVQTWLSELSGRYDRPTGFADVPSSEWDALASTGVDAVWLMGVWERSPAGIEIARDTPSLLPGYRAALSDYTPEDVAGSPYCIRGYDVDPAFGGRDGLRQARRELGARGLRLLLDFVPNHVAPDHPWVSEHPEYFIRFDRAEPGVAFEAGGHSIAHGRDPNFAPWTDTAQVNAFSPELRRAAMATVCDIAGQCDGVRCDMAMLMLTAVFERTWGARAGSRPGQEYWRELIGAVRDTHPDFLFVAEAYWNLEWELQQQGFDYCYDKRLYDRLVHEHASTVRAHLGASLGYQSKLLRFLENHDEPRAAAVFAPDRERAAAVATFTLPGARLIHEGQIDGLRVRLPVQLRRRPVEWADPEMRTFYDRLLGAIRFGGEWAQCEVSGWPDNQSCRNLVAWSWRRVDALRIVVVNLSGNPAQGRVRVPWPELEGREFHFVDRLSGETYHRSGEEIGRPGLFVSLPGWGYHLLDSQV